MHPYPLWNHPTMSHLLRAIWQRQKEDITRPDQQTGPTGNSLLCPINPLMSKWTTIFNEMQSDEIMAPATVCISWVRWCRLYLLSGQTQPWSSWQFHSLLNTALALKIGCRRWSRGGGGWHINIPRVFKTPDHHPSLLAHRGRLGGKLFTLSNALGCSSFFDPHWSCYRKALVSLTTFPSSCLEKVEQVNFADLPWRMFFPSLITC